MQRSLRALAKFGTVECRIDQDVGALVSLVGGRRRRTRTLVGVGGPVAVGKTTLAHALAGALRDSGTSAEVVTTDGFLLPNAELDARGLTMRKGFPESFDAEKFSAFLIGARETTEELRAPRYSHVTYDVVPGEDVVPPADVLVVEGVNVLLPEHIDALDLSIYVDADDDAVIGWFCARLGELCRNARNQPESFFAPYAWLTDDQLEAFALGAWNAINALNLEHHIRPARDNADVVVRKGADHTIERVELRQSNERA